MILRGDFRGSEGKVTEVFPKKGRIYIENVTIKKVDGTPKYVPIHASKVNITKLDVTDDWRTKVIERKKSGGRREVENAR